MKRVGVLFGMENTFPPALVERINQMNAGVVAEFVQVGATVMAEPMKYDVIIDRISQDIPYYRSYLKNAALGGATVINDPFWWSADDKFFNYALASKLGVATPKTVLLPSQHHPSNTTSQSMRNMVFPLPWKEIFDYVGFPAFLKPYSGGGWKHVYKIHNEGDFFHYYHQTGDLVMTLQESIEFDSYFRCYCIGRENVRVMPYDPRRSHEDRYVRGGPPTEPALEARIVRDCITLCQALGYDINTLEFAVRGNVPYAIDFLNPAPDADYYSVGPENFTWVVDAVAGLAVKRALNKEEEKTEYRWASALGKNKSDGREQTSVQPVREKKGVNISKK
jgi:glutathione synthase/RimK-type ligase-like ATP-grasp enzyme